MAPDTRRLLGVNIDHVATLRQVREASYPDLAAAVRAVEDGGADFITAHLREDRRHIQDADIPLIMATATTWLNLELAITPAMVAIACEYRPRTVCLVPEKREELTTEGGLDVAGHHVAIAAAVAQLQADAIGVSLFIDPEPHQVVAAHDVGATAVELHTGTYANVTGARQDEELDKLRTAAVQAAASGLIVNIGHGLTLTNVGPVAHLPHAHEFNIGHSIVADAVFVGLAAAVSRMRVALEL